MVSPVGDEDRTGRARVRDAALAEFAERGVAGASVRSVAARAGVSPGLVQHHFVTKDALREACDEYVVAFVRRAALDDTAGERAADLLAEAAPVGAYLGRALTDGSAAAAGLFDELVAVTEAYLAALPGREPGGGRDRAVVLAAMRLSTVVLAGHVARAMGVDPAGTAYAARVGAAVAEVLNPDLVTPSARGAVAALRPPNRPSHEEET